MSEHWRQTYSGQVVDLLEPDPESIDASDIARSLARMARFNGHTTCPGIHSVAHHSVMISLACGGPPRRMLVGLLHDAAEAYVGDLIAPVKRIPEIRAAFLAVEERVQEAIWERFDAHPTSEDLAAVRVADLRVLATERRDLMAHCDRYWRLPEPPLAERIVPLRIEQAECLFLSLLRFLLRKAGGRP